MSLRHDAPIPDPETSHTAGRAQRDSVPRAAHGDLADRPTGFDPVQVLIDQGQGRVEDLLPIRYGRMAAEPFSFLRGAAAVMAADIAMGPSTDLTVQLCGDAHLSNFGVYSSPERRLVFDINDFDETHPGPFEWDVKRLVASIAVAGESIGLSAGQQERAVLAAVGEYRTAMRTFATQNTLDVFYSRLEVETFLTQFGSALSDEAMRRTENLMAKARTKDSRKAYNKLVVVEDGRPRIKADPPLVTPLADLAGATDVDSLYAFLEDVLANYTETLDPDRADLVSRFTPIDGARKVVGVGSVGTRCFVILLLGKDGGDPFFLQVKEANASVLEQHLGASTFSTHGMRVVAGQKKTQAASDVFLGWFNHPDANGIERDFYVRQLYDGKASADVSTMTSSMLRTYSQLCGWTLARAHARTGDRFAIAAYLGKGDVFDRAMVSFALAYVRRNHEDHRALTEAIAAGRVAAQLA